MGVFQGPTMGDPIGFANLYNFELYSLIIEKSKNPDSDFYYLCDGFEEKKLNNKWNVSYSTDTIFFDSGSANIKQQYYKILDSLPKKLRTVQDLVSLYAYTDKKGKDSDNKELGAARNNSVRNELLKRGIDSTRILMTNYGETKSSGKISQKNRRVEIDVNLGKLYQKYYTEALKFTQKGNYGAANRAIKTWMRLVPPNQAVYALFDCWGNGKKASMFKKNLTQRIQKKFYKNNKLKFILDSLYCENIKGEGLGWYITTNCLPSYENDCSFNTSSKRTSHLIQIADSIYSKLGFPSKEKVEKRCSNVLPDIILKNNNISNLKRYLPIFKKACEQQQIKWKYFAMLYDKINVKHTGFQRYGTQTMINIKGEMIFINPIEDIHKLNEYRKQMKLVPYPENVTEKTIINQKKLDTTLVYTLSEIYPSDQRYRNKTHEIEEKYGYDSDTLNSLWKIIRTTDSLNQIQVRKILDKRDWLSSK